LTDQSQTKKGQTDTMKTQTDSTSYSVHQIGVRTQLFSVQIVEGERFREGEGVDVGLGCGSQTASISYIVRSTHYVIQNETVTDYKKRCFIASEINQ